MLLLFTIFKDFLSINEITQKSGLISKNHPDVFSTIILGASASQGTILIYPVGTDTTHTLDSKNELKGEISCFE